MMECLGVYRVQPPISQMAKVRPKWELQPLLSEGSYRKKIIAPYPTTDQTGPGKEVAQMMVETSGLQCW